MRINLSNIGLPRTVYWEYMNGLLFAETFCNWVGARLPEAIQFERLPKVAFDQLTNREQENVEGFYE